MSDTYVNSVSPSDDELLERIRVRMSGVEPLVGAPPAWRSDGPVRASQARYRMNARVRARGAVGFGAALAIVLAAIVVVASLGALGPRNSGSGARPTAFTAVTTKSYELVTPNGVQPSAGDLYKTIEVLKARAESMGASGVTVTARPPAQVSVSFSGNVDTVALGELLGQTGSFEIVLLPPETYGTSDSPGSKRIPYRGEPIDPALPAQFTDADMNPNGFVAEDELGGQGRFVVYFSFDSEAVTRFATWTGQHLHQYFALALDGVVLSVPYVYSQVDTGMGYISDYYTEESAEKVARLLRSGQLPFPVKLVSSSTSTPAPQLQPGSSPTAFTIGRAPTGPEAIITYRLASPDGGTPSAAALEQTARMLAFRMASFFPTDLTTDAAGTPILDLSSVEGFSVTATAPDQIVVSFRADVPVGNSFFVWDPSSIRKWLAHPGRLELVDLPPAIYGTSGSPGPQPLPSAGTTIDPALSPLLTRSDVASISGGYSSAAGGVLRFDFTSAGAATMARYSEVDTGHYLALTLDGVVLVTTEMAGQGRYGTLQMTSPSNEAGSVLGWLFEDGNSPLPGALAEVSFSSGGSSASPAPPADATPAAATAAPSPGGSVGGAIPTAIGTFMEYVVRDGDTLAYIAARFNVSLANLEAANPQLRSFDMIEVGSILNIPWHGWTP
jgi:hypothetical protein